MGGRSDTNSVIKRFMENVTKVDAETGCWLWQGARTEKGYGQFTIGSERVRAHRMSYELFRGPLPEDTEVDHVCRNPSCVNPAHLQAVTTRENARRKGLSPAEHFAQEEEIEELPAAASDQATVPQMQEEVTLRRWNLQVPIAAAEGDVYIPVRALCACLGVSSDMQVRRIKQHAILKQYLRRFALAGPRGGRQPTYCLSKRAIGFWLGSISIGHVREDVRDGLLDFQTELLRAADALLFSANQEYWGRLEYKGRTFEQWFADIEGFADLTHKRLGDVEERIHDLEEGDDNR